MMSSSHVSWALFPIVALIGSGVVNSGSCTGHIQIIFEYIDSAHP